MSIVSLLICSLSSMAFATTGATKNGDVSETNGISSYATIPDYTYKCLNGTVYLSPYTYVGNGYTTSGNSVRVLQGFLSWEYYYYNIAGMNPGAIDGQFGTNTYNALYQFQSITQGLTPDGIAGPQTWESINSVYKGNSQPTLQFNKV